MKKILCQIKKEYNFNDSKKVTAQIFSYFPEDEINDNKIYVVQGS